MPATPMIAYGHVVKSFDGGAERVVRVELREERRSCRVRGARPHLPTFPAPAAPYTQQTSLDSAPGSLSSKQKMA